MRPRVFSQKARESPEYEHGRFTHCLVELANQKPSHEDRITLSQAITYIHHRLVQIGNDQTVEVSSHSVNPVVCLFRNPLFSLESIDFGKQIEAIFKLAGCDILPTQPDESVASTFIIRERLGFARQSQTFVMCLNNTTINVVDAHISQFNQLFSVLQRSEQVTNGILVTRNKLPPRLERLLSPKSVIQAKTKHELQASLD